MPTCPTCLVAFASEVTHCPEHGQQLLPDDWMATTTTAIDVTTEEDGYGAGWWVNRRPDGTLVHPELPEDTYFAEGHDGQWIVVVPSYDLVVVRMGFSPTVDDEGVPALAAAVIATLPAPGTDSLDG